MSSTGATATASTASSGSVVPAPRRANVEALCQAIDPGRRPSRVKIGIGEFAARSLSRRVGTFPEDFVPSIGARLDGPNHVFQEKLVRER